MSRKKLVIMTPVLAPPHPNEVDCLSPLGRQVMNVIIKQYKEMLYASHGLSAEHQNETLSLSPIPEISSKTALGNIEFTVDTERRNKKKMKKAEENYNKFVRNPRNVPDNLNRFELDNSNSEQIDQENISSPSTSNDSRSSTAPETNTHLTIENTKRTPSPDRSQTFYRDNVISNTFSSHENGSKTKFNFNKFKSGKSKDVLNSLRDTPLTDTTTQKSCANDPVRNNITRNKTKSNKGLESIRNLLKQFEFQEREDNEVEPQKTVEGSIESTINICETVHDAERLEPNEDNFPAIQLKDDNPHVMIPDRTPNINHDQAIEENQTFYNDNVISNTFSLVKNRYRTNLNFDKFKSSDFDEGDSIVQNPNDAKSKHNERLKQFEFREREDNNNVINADTTNISEPVNSVQQSIKSPNINGEKTIDVRAVESTHATNNITDVVDDVESPTSSDKILLNNSQGNERVQLLNDWIRSSQIDDLCHYSLEDHAPVNKIFENESNRTIDRHVNDVTMDICAEPANDKKISNGESNIFSPYLDIAKLNDAKSSKKCPKAKAPQRKSYVMEVDYSAPKPRKTIQTKITSLLKIVKDGNVKRKQDKPVENIVPSKKIKSNVQENNGNGKLKPQIETQLATQTEVKDLHYEYVVLDDESANKLIYKLRNEVPVEMCFNIIYKEGFCHISQPLENKLTPKTATGMIIGISWMEDGLSVDVNSEFYYLPFSESLWKNFTIPKCLLNACFMSTCRKLSYRTQSLYLLLINLFKFPDNEVILRWHILDPLIGCWLLNPDDMPTSFRDILSTVHPSLNYKLSSNDAQEKACDMVIALSRVAEIVYKYLSEKILWNVFVDVETKIVRILAVMEHRGLCVDINKLKSMGMCLKRKLDTVQKKAYALVGRPFQINSTVQLRSILYDELKLDTKYNIKIKETTALNAKSTSEPMLQLLRKVHQLPGLILEYRRLYRARGSFIDSIIKSAKEGQIFSRWEQTNNATGRISSNPNLQAVPKHPFPLSLFPENADETDTILHLRSPYKAREGHSLLSAELQHIDLRVFAHLSQDSAIINAVNAEGDIFINLTYNLFGIKEVTNDQREQTKKIVYAIMNGAGVNGLAEILSVEFEDALMISQRFKNNFPGLRLFKQRTVELCRKQGFLRSLLGRIRSFPNINSSVMSVRTHSERQAVNFCIQGSAADIFKTAMISTMEKLAVCDNLECKLLLQIHDELVWEIHDSHLERAKVIIKDAMDNPNLFGNFQLSVSLPVTIKSGKNWGNMV